MPLALCNGIHILIGYNDHIHTVCSFGGGVLVHTVYIHYTVKYNHTGSHFGADSFFSCIHIFTLAWEFE